jgi:hypothetical protein
MKLWRVDYMAAQHPWWLSKEDELFSDVGAAVKRAQTLMERWEKCEGWRIVKMTHEVSQKITDDHVGQIVDEAGRQLMPWNLQPWPGRSEMKEAA